MNDDNNLKTYSREKLKFLIKVVYWFRKKICDALEALDIEHFDASDKNKMKELRQIYILMDKVEKGLQRISNNWF